jgi:hypothetical protein
MKKTSPEKFKIQDWYLPDPTVAQPGRKKDKRDYTVRKAPFRNRAVIQTNWITPMSD